MKTTIKLLFLFTIFLLSTSTLNAAVTLGECQSEDGQHSKDVTNVTDYTLDIGFDSNAAAFVPSEIELYYDNEDCSGDIVSYHAHNDPDDDEERDASFIESNFSLGGDFSSYLFIPSRVSSTTEHFEWIVYGSILNLKDSFTINLNEKDTSGDPFEGKSRNTSANIQARIDFGSSDKLCRLKVIVKDADKKLSWTGKDVSQACRFVLSTTSPETKTSYSYHADVSIKDAGKENLPYETALYNSADKHIGTFTIGINDDDSGFKFTLLDLDGNLLE